MQTSRPPASSESVRKRFSAQKRTGTAPEMHLRRALFRAGYRYRVDYPVPGLPRRKIDIAFPRQRIAIFVDGCFWHLCPQHSVPSKTNSAWWRDKLQENARRDHATNSALTTDGWRVIRVWEHQELEHALGLIRLELNHDASSVSRMSS